MSRRIEAAIEHRTLIRAGADKVYDAITTAAGLDGWFTEGAVVDARPGGQVHFKWKDWSPDRITAEDGGPVLEAVRPERFVFQWHADGGSYTTVELEFTAVNDGTVVQVREHGYQDTPVGLKTMLWCAAGWGEALTLLKFYVEHGLRY